MRGLFVGLITLDCIYQAQHPPRANEKQVADAAMMVAGGPATNAAVAFAALGGQATLMAAIGQHPVTALLRDDLAQVGVILHDVTPHRRDPPPVSSIVVSQGTGERAVISRNAVGLQVELQAPPDLAAVDIILVDGHQMALGRQVASHARRLGIPVVVDAGSWKPGFEDVLALATVVIASANFQPPGGLDPMAYLHTLGIPHVAITRGERPILGGNPSWELPVPQVSVVDTLGAGDIFHGAFCHGWAGDFRAALAQAAQVAAQSCQSFGTRTWMGQPRMEPPES